jgi:hypothetical protein
MACADEVTRGVELIEINAPASPVLNGNPYVKRQAETADNNN